MNASDQRIARILQGAGLIDDGQLRTIDKWQQQWGGKVHQIAVDQGLAPEAAVATALARGLNLPRVDLATTAIEPTALQTLDRNFCEENVVIPVALRDNGATLWAAVADPTDVALLDRVRARARVARVMPGVAGYRELLAAIRQNYGGVAIGVDDSYGIDLAGSGEEEFKVTNIAGSTVVKHVPGAEQLRDDGAPAAAVPDPSAIDPRSVYLGAADPAADEGEVFASAPAVGADGLSDGDRARLEAIARGLRQSERALAAVVELCERKGLFAATELRERS